MVPLLLGSELVSLEAGCTQDQVLWTCQRCDQGIEFCAGVELHNMMHKKDGCSGIML